MNKLAIFSLLGVIVGWILNEVSFLIRTRHQDKRRLKEVLFNLLEVWHYLKISNPEIIIDTLVNVVSVRYRVPNNGVSFLKEFYRDFFNDFLQNFIKKNINKLKKRYENSITYLAQIDPYLAYKLSEKTSIYEYIDTFEKKIKNLEENISKDHFSFNKEELESMKSLLSSFIIKDSIKDIENDIKKIAKKINFLYGIKISKRLKKYDQFVIKELNKKLDNYLKKFEERRKRESNSGYNPHEMR